MNGWAKSRRQMAFVLPLAAALVWTVSRLSPPEQVMGERISLLYVHASVAWISYLAYGLTAVAALAYLRSGARPWDRWSLASAELGWLFTSLTLITGSLWARAIQGWWWTWEPRLTLTLMLWFLYASYGLFRQVTPGPAGARLAAVLALLGVPVAILNHFAVQIYRSFHPEPVILRPEGPALGDARYLAALLVSVLALSAVFAVLLRARVRLEEQREEVTRALLALEDPTPDHG